MVSASPGVQAAVSDCLSPRHGIRVFAPRESRDGSRVIVASTDLRRPSLFFAHRSVQILKVRALIAPRIPYGRTSPPLRGLGSARWLLPDASTWRSPLLVVCGRPRSASKNGLCGYLMRFPTWQRSSRVPPAAGARDRARRVPLAILLPKSAEWRVRSPDHAG